MVGGELQQSLQFKIWLAVFEDVANNPLTTCLICIATVGARRSQVLHRYRNAGNDALVKVSVSLCIY